MPQLTKNKAVYFNYEIREKYEAGICLTGPEVKSAKAGQIDLKGSYITIRNNEAYLINARIAPYQMARAVQTGYDPNRTRKLLFHRHEIDELRGALTSKGLTILPLSVYTIKGIIKIAVGLGRGKKKADKREAIKKREVKRKIERALRQKT